MHRTIAACLLTSALLFATASSAAGQNSPAADPKIKVGDTAPDFTLRDQNGKEVKLSDFRGKKDVVLAFYVFAFTGG